jgi:hypothetical protein
MAHNVSASKAVKPYQAEFAQIEPTPQACEISRIRISLILQTADHINPTGNGQGKCKIAKTMAGIECAKEMDKRGRPQ